MVEKWQILHSILLVLLLLFAVLTVFAVGIYEFQWDNKLTRNFLTFVSLPAAVVNGKLIPLARVNERLAAYRHLVSFQSDFDFSSGAGREKLSDERRAILTALVEEEIVADLAEKRGVVVTGRELERYFRYLLREFGMARTQEADREIVKLLGLTGEQFKRAIVLPDLRRAQLAISLLTEAADSEKYQLAVKTREELEAGKDFVETATSVSEDEETRYLGGELGFMAEEDLPPWLSDAALDLELGEISEVIISPEGYYLLQVVARDERAEPPRVHLRQIVIKSDPLADYLMAQKQNYRVYVFAKL